MNLNEQRLMVKWFVAVIVGCLLVQFSLMITMMMSSRHQSYRGEYSEPSQYAEPENSFRDSAITVSLLHIIRHKILLLFQSIHQLFDNRWVLYNCWNSLTQDEYSKPMNYVISKTDYPFLMSAESVCPEENVTPLALILILSVWSSKEKREAVRRTWASGDYKCSFTQENHVVQWVDENSDRFIDFGSSENVMFWKNAVRHVFIFGLPEGQIERQAALDILEEENQKYNDIVVADFHDTYRNLSVKSLTGLKWATLNCPGVHFVVKVDQDVFVHLPRLLMVIRQKQYREVITGRYTDGIGWTVFRTGRYAIQYQAYPFDGGFPPHVKGGIYVMPLHIAKLLIDVAPFMPYVSVEDVYVTGILRQAVGAKATAFPYDVYDEFVKDLRHEVTEYIHGIRFASHPVASVANMEYMWAVLHKATIC